MPRVARLALIGACLLLAAFGAVKLERWISRPPMIFVDRQGPAGFRDLVAEGDEARAGLSPFDRAAAAPGAVCAALFDDADDPRVGAGPVAAVFFTDYRCPYCRILGDLLFERAAADEITLIVKEWPILGPASQDAARLALAAARQDAFLPAHTRLTQTPFVPNAAYAADLAGLLGLDPARLAADAAGPEIEAQLARVAALAEGLGFEGTPGLVLGRTVALRPVRGPLLDRMIRAERGLGAPPC